MLEDNENVQPAVPELSFTSNFPVPGPMKISGDRVNGWNFFRQQWEDFELATGLDKRSQAVRLATLRSIIGKECLEIFLNLKLSEEERRSITGSMAALEAYFKPKTSMVYERYLFNSCVQSTDEGIDEYVNRLRRAASSCKFGTLTDELINNLIIEITL